MAIDPEVIPSSSSEGTTAVRFVPKWVIYSIVLLAVLLIVGVVKTLLPLIVMVALMVFIWKQAKS